MNLQPKDINNLLKKNHIKYCIDSLTDLSIYIYISIEHKVFHYDTGHPWILYWLIHSLYLLNDKNANKRVISLHLPMIKML